MDARVADLVERMTLAEKIDSLDTSAKAIDSLGLVPYNWWSEATHGISHVNNDHTTPCAIRRKTLARTRQIQVANVDLREAGLRSE